MMRGVLRQPSAWLIVLATASLGCATYAKRDYDAYPGWETEIATYNIEQIFKDGCDEHRVTADRLFCKKVKKCHSKGQAGPHPCFDDLTFIFDIYPRVQAVGCQGKLLRISSLVGRPTSISGGHYPGTLLTRYRVGSFKNQQCQDLVEAIGYLRRK
jgi:hypothetical protein